MLNARTARRPTVEEDVAEALAFLRKQSQQQLARVPKGGIPVGRSAEDDEERVRLREARMFSADGDRDGAASGEGIAPLSRATTNGGGQAHTRFMPGLGELAASRPAPFAGAMQNRSAPLQTRFIPGLGELSAGRMRQTMAQQTGARAPAGSVQFGEQRQGFRPMSLPSPPRALPIAISSNPSRRSGGDQKIAPGAPTVAGQTTRGAQLWRPARMQQSEIGPPMDPGVGTSSTLQGARRMREAMPSAAEALDPEVERVPARRRLDPARPEGPALPRIMVRRTRRDRPGWNRYAPNINDMDDMDLRDVDEIVFHHTGNERIPQDVERLHRTGQDEMSWLRDLGPNLTRGRLPYRWADVGYHYMIAEDGTVYEGRNARYEGSHAAKRGGNRNSIGVAFLGDYTDRPLTRQQLASARALILGLQDHAGQDQFQYSTHGEYDEDKRNEVRGGFAQLQQLERQLAADRDAIRRAPDAERAILTARLVDTAEIEAQAAREEARRAARAAREARQRELETARRRTERRRYGPHAP